LTGYAVAIRVRFLPAVSVVFAQHPPLLSSGRSQLSGCFSEIEASEGALPDS